MKSTLSPWQRMTRMMEAWFSLDLRSLALFRVLAGVLVLTDLAIRSIDLTMFYTDQGILPRWLVLLRAGNALDLSLYNLGGHWLYVALLFGITAAFALMYMLGYRTRIASVGLWLMMFSLHARNEMVNNQGDQLLLLILFWSMFLPMGAYFSIDRMRSTSPPLPPRIFSMATAGLLLQIVMLYWFSIIHKSGDSWRLTGHALIYSLHTETYVTSLGVMLRELPLWLLNSMSLGVYLCEILAPLLLFSPWLHGPVRTLGVLFLIGLHSGFILFIELGMFAYIDVIVLLSLLPAAFWNFLAKRRKNPPTNHAPEAFAPPYQPSRGSEWLAGALIVYLFFWNVGTITPKFKMPAPLASLGECFRLDQRWDMFSPDPPDDDNRYVIPALLNDGSWVDIFKWVGPFHGKIKLDWKRPKLLSSMFRSSRWVDYFSDIWTDHEEKPKHRKLNWALWTHWICRQWNSSKPPHKKIKRMQFFVIEERVQIRNNKAYRAHPIRHLTSDLTCQQAADLVKSNLDR